MKDAGKGLDKEHDGDHAEGIGDAVADRNHVGSRRFDAGRKARRRRERAGQKAEGQVHGDAREGNDQEAHSRARYDNGCADHDIGARFSLEVLEEARARDEADSRDKGGEADVLYDRRHLESEVTEDKRHDQDPGRAEADAADADPAKRIAEGHDEKQ